MVVFLWPFIVLAVGIAFVSVFDIFHGFFGFSWLVAFFVVWALLKARGGAKSLAPEQKNYEQLNQLRRSLVMLSIAMLFPVFVRYLVDAFMGVLPIVILALLLSFGFLIWGLFVKQHKTIMIGNVVGGGISLLYLYFKIWEMGEGTRIVAAGLGLLIAVTLSIVKLREKNLV